MGALYDALASVTFSHMYPLVRAARNRGYLEDGDFAPFRRRDFDAEQLCARLRRTAGSGKGLLTRLLVVFSRETAVSLVLGVVFSACKIAEVVELGNFVAALIKRKSAELLYIHGAALVALVFLHGLLHHHFFNAGYTNGLKWKQAVTALSFRNLLDKNIEFAQASNLLNLLGNDVQRFEEAASWMAFIVVGPIETIVIFVLVYLQLGIASLAGYALLCCLIPSNVVFSKLFVIQRKKLVVARDSRIGFLKDVINFVETIKMYTWERAMSAKVGEYRVRELRFLWRSALLKIFNDSVFFASTPLIGLVSFTTYYLINGSPPDVDKIVIVIGYLSVTKMTMYKFLPKSVEFWSEACVSAKRIDDFLQRESCVPADLAKGILKPADPLTPVVELVDTSLRWRNAMNPIVQGVNMGIKARDHVFVAGDVGSGKTSLLLGILGEVQKTQGRSAVRGAVSYASQEPWIFAGTIKDNILFGSAFDQERFSRVVDVCGLARDLNEFESAEETSVSDRGSNLSGGQRARINLARCVYRRAEIYLLDDPISSVDAHVARRIMQKCVCEFLDGKTVIFVSHQRQFASLFNFTATINNGAVKMYRTQSLITGESSLEDDPIARSVLEKCGEIDLSDSTHEPLQEKARESRTVPVQTQLSMINLSSQSRAIAASAYWAYFASGNLPGVPVLFFIMLILGQVAFFLAEISLMGWSKSGGSANLHLYLSFSVAMLLLAFSRSAVFYRMVLNSARVLFIKMLGGVIDSPMSFFREHDFGEVMNRLSKDQTVIEEHLPYVFFDLLQLGSIILGNLVFTALTSFISVVAILPLTYLFYRLRRTYLRASRIIKRFEATSRGPIFGLISATMDGLPTIRSSAQRHSIETAFMRRLDSNTNYTLCFIELSRWLGLRLDFLAVGLLGTVVLVSIFTDFADPAVIALSLSYIMQLMGVLQWTTRQSAEVENMMVSVERVLEYATLPSDASLKPRAPPTGPPLDATDAHIVFDGVSLRYSAKSAPALRDVSVTVPRGAKVGCVGRTGAGKSSLLQALFRMYDIEEGSVRIDGWDIREHALRDLRSSIAIIPQTPLVFRGLPLRFNLDPAGEFRDETLWSVLDAVGLRQALYRPGLDAIVGENQGVSFSMGEQQLIALARAYLRNTDIIVFDEATSNINNSFDETIKETIKRDFPGVTCLTIAHRISSVMDSDLVIVMDGGQVVERGAPAELMGQEGGRFRAMAQG